MIYKNLRNSAAVLFFGIALSCAARSAPTRVGNGDDGGDLEAGTPVTSGILIETRDEAVALLRKLNVPGIEGLGQLIHETEKAPLVIVGKNVDVAKIQAAPEARETALEEARAIGAVTDGNLPVYARTFSEPHAATRFFPVALMLDRKQLIALHVHEALHRALPEEIRENEAAVSRITLAITSTDSSFDRIKEVASKEVLAGREKKAAALASSALRRGEGLGAEGSTRAALKDPFANPIVKTPSSFEYGFRSFSMPEPDKSLAPVRSMHSLKSFLYPFGRAEALGVGLEFTYVNLPERSYLGPLGISGRLKLTTWRGFDVDAFAALHMNTIAAGEIKNTPLGRDTGTVGLAIRRDDRRYRIENQIFTTAGSEAKQKLGAIEYVHRYGAITGASVLAAVKIPTAAESSIELGGFGQVLLANPYEVEGGAFKYTSDRTRVVSVGPEVALNVGDLRFSANGRFVIDSTNGVQLDQLGDLLGHGVGQGSFGGAMTWKF